MQQSLTPHQRKSSHFFPTVADLSLSEEDCKVLLLRPRVFDNAWTQMVMISVSKRIGGMRMLNEYHRIPFSTLLSVAALKMQRYFTPSQNSIFLNQPNKKSILLNKKNVPCLNSIN